MAENSEIPAEKPQQSIIDQMISFFRRARAFTQLSYYKLGNVEKANMELGIRQLKKGDYFDASLRFRFVLMLNKNNAIAYYLLGKTYFYRGLFAKSVEPFRKALKLMPELEEAKFLLACAGKSADIRAIPRSFIIEKLDYISQGYDSFVETTASHIRAALSEELKKIIGENMGFNVLDLGCRGGDMGEILRGSANAITGVEPSLKMVAIARNRRVDNLLTFNLISAKFPEDYLKECKDKYAVVLSTYYLDNLGALDEYFKLVHKVMETGGLFAFNINLAGGADYTFKPGSLIFAHSDAYIKRLSTETGFEIVVTREVKYPNNTIDLVYVLEKK